MPVTDAEILKYSPLVQSFARRFVGKFRRKSSYQDLVQAGWLGMLKGLKNYDPSRGITLGAYSRAWIWGSMYREIHGRKKKAFEVEIGLPPQLASMDRPLTDLRDAIATLSPMQAEFIEMIWLEGETAESACARMGMIFVEPQEILRQIQTALKEVVNYYYDDTNNNDS
jgi:RNA polymerase sigma factor (sigma-70 family)